MQESCTTGPAYNFPERGGGVEITYTNIVLMDSEEIPFQKLPEEKRAWIGNYLRRLPLQTLGDVAERTTA